MAEFKKVKPLWYYGHAVSAYGQEHRRVDYRTFAQAFDAVLNNDIIGILDDFEQIGGFIADDEDEPEVFQWFIVSDNAVSILAMNNEIVYYSEKADMYLWGVTHCGTSWAYVLTDIRWDDEEGRWVNPDEYEDDEE